MSLTSSFDAKNVEDAIIRPKSRPPSHHIKVQRGSTENIAADDSPIRRRTLSERQQSSERPKTSSNSRTSLKSDTSNHDSVKSSSQIRPPSERPRSLSHIPRGKNSPTVSSNEEASWEIQPSKRNSVKRSRYPIREKLSARSAPIMGDGIASLMIVGALNEMPTSEQKDKNCSMNLPISRQSSSENRVLTLRTKNYAAGRTVESIRKYPRLKKVGIQFSTGPVRTYVAIRMCLH